MLKKLVSDAVIMVFDEASEAAAAKEAAKEAADAKAAAAAAGGGDKTFTQEEVNTIMAKEKTITQKAQADTIAELDALKSRADLTKTQRDELETRITAMKKSNMTADELARSDRKKADTEHQEQVITLTNERDAWKGKYTQETITRSIVDASVEHDALVPEQIIAILQPTTQLEEVVKEDGTKTGTYIPKVSFEVTDDDGQTKTLNLTVSEAVKKMREIEKYQNLFKIEGQGGLGQYTQSGTTGSGKIDIKKISQDAAAYRKARADGKL